MIAHIVMYINLMSEGCNVRPNSQNKSKFTIFGQTFTRDPSLWTALLTDHSDRTYKKTA